MNLCKMKSLLLGVIFLACLWGCASPLQPSFPLGPDRGPVAVENPSKEEGTEPPEISEEPGDLSEEAEDVTFLTDLEQAEEVETPGTNIPIADNDSVDYFLKLFQGPQKTWMKRALKHSGRYTPQMKEIFREEGLPEDLVYLALIESGFNPYAYSRAGAVGIWQFMRSTAKRYGLVINWWVDERKDLEKSTRAAARYLKDLYGLFDDWYLAAAAYNAGEGKIQRAVRKYESNNFWNLSKKRYLKKETKNYVPRFLAALKIAKEPDFHGFGIIDPEPPFRYEGVIIKDATDLAVIAEGCGYKLSYLKRLNPQLKRGCTPPSYRGDYEVKVPEGTKNRFLAFYEQLEPNKRLTFRRHRIRKGETLSHIARRYGVSIRSISDMNGLKSRNRIREGKNLVIPIPVTYASRGGFGSRKATVHSASRKRILPDYSRQGFRKIVHTVEQGDSLWTISRDYAVGLSSLKTWNGMTRTSRIFPGQQILIWKETEGLTRTASRDSRGRRSAADEAGPDSARFQGNGKKLSRDIVHVVRKGDSLWDISRDYDVGMSSLLALNRLSRNTPIYPGQTLLIRKGDREERSSAGSGDSNRTKNAFAVSRGSGKIIHVVKKGDSLWTISRAHRVELPSLLAWNGLSERSSIYPGQNVVIWKEAAMDQPRSEETFASVATADDTDDLQEIWHTVEPGENLWRIARRFRVTVAQISRWNKLDAHRPIHPGLTLRICQMTRQKRNIDLYADSRSEESSYP